MKWLFSLAIFALAACGSGSENSEASGAAADSTYDEARQIAWNEKGMEAIKAKLKDADSAKFRNVKFYSGVAPVTCGEVNAKNSFGGYSGYERFIAGGDVINVLESEMKDGEMDDAWRKICF